MRKVTILTWAVVLLAVMNVVTVATIIYHNYNEQQQEDMVVKAGYGSNALNGKFFRQQLGFNDEQMNKFREANSLFRPAAIRITAAIDSLKEEMFTELQKPVPDTVKLNGISAGIGLLHGRLKKETSQFYFKLKMICTPEQLGQLNEEFRPLFINDETTPASRYRQKTYGRGNK